MRRARTILRFLWLVFLGAVFCTRAVGSLLVIGWTYRLMDRRVLRRWRILYPQDAISPPPAMNKAPNWMLRDSVWMQTQSDWQTAESWRHRGKLMLRAVGGALWHNLRLGAQGLLTTLSLTIIPCMLWAFGWYLGWNNSFTKGYEQAYTGTLIATTGIALFIAVMLYVPLAQARHAATGEWRAFYQFRVVRRLIQRRPWALLFLALAYSVSSIPVAFLKTLPLFLPNINPELNTMTDAELLQFLNGYFFLVSILGFLLYVALRVAAARIYAGAFAEAVRAKHITQDDLRGHEAARLALTGLRVPRPGEVQQARRPPIPFKSAPLRVAAVLMTAAIWFTFVAQIFVSEFFNYHGPRGWLNQPLVQAPWFKHIPPHLAEDDTDTTA